MVAESTLTTHRVDLSSKYWMTLAAAGHTLGKGEQEVLTAKR